MLNSPAVDDDLNWAEVGFALTAGPLSVGGGDDVPSPPPPPLVVINGTSRVNVLNGDGDRIVVNAAALNVADIKLVYDDFSSI